MKQLLALLAILVLPIAVCAQDRSPPITLSGTYVLVDHVKGIEAPDLIGFHSDGTCLLNLDGSNGLTGNYFAGTDGSLKINPTPTAPSLSYTYEQGKVSMKITTENQEDLYYCQLPAQAPRVTFNDVLGIYSYGDENGDSAGEITADHRFREHIHEFSVEGPSGLGAIIASFFKGNSGERHVYYDVTMDGTCSLDNGVITYTVQHITGSPQQDQSFADILVKIDSSGFWIVDPYHDKVICEPPAKSLDLPPPPDGYTLATPQ